MWRKKWIVEKRYSLGEKKQARLLQRKEKIRAGKKNEPIPVRRGKKKKKKKKKSLQC